MVFVLIFLMFRFEFLLEETCFIQSSQYDQHSQQLDRSSDLGQVFRCDAFLEASIY